MDDRADKTQQTKTALLGEAPEAPGATPCLVVIHTRETALLGKRFALDRGPVTVGRGADNHIVLDGESVSRRHATFEWTDASWLVSDLGSHNGTYCNDERVAGKKALRDGDRVKIGPTVFKFFAGARVIQGASLPQADEEGMLVLSEAMRAVCDSARRAAEQGRISVLFLGETGVGKDEMARAVHRWSRRAQKPFVALHCAAMPEALLESQLFGHERGAFTGASHDRPGFFEVADGGTIFLDEVGELPASIQVKLLRVLEDRKVLRIGGRTARSVDVRFISATNRDLEADAAKGTFRLDLFYRLNGISLTIPPLRQRTEEIEPLARFFLAEERRRGGGEGAPILSDEALAALLRYGWPGNVRELRHVMERALVLCSGDTVLPAHLPERITSPAPEAEAGEGPKLAPSSSERQRILDALEQCGSNQTEAAKLLGISRRTLLYRLDEYNIQRPRKKGGRSWDETPPSSSPGSFRGPRTT
jgi:DNA-binding NtrC family response regulator